MNNKRDSLRKQKQYEIVIELHEIENLSNLIKKNHLKNQFKNTLLSFFLLNNKYDSLDKQQQYEILIKLRETENLSNDLIKKKSS